MTKRPPLRAYAVWIVGHEDHPAVVNAFTLASARYQHYLEVRDVVSDLRITDLRGRSLGAPQTSAMLERVASQRGRPELRAGVVVVVDDGCQSSRSGYVVDGNYSSNLEILFMDGTRGIVHPGEVKVERSEAEADRRGAA